MKSFSQFNEENEEENEVPQTVSFTQKIQDSISKEIDMFLNKLKRQLVGSSGGQKGMWDRIKQWWSNRVHGRDNEKNPYYWQNQFGDNLGSTIEHISLQEYNVLKYHSDILESKLILLEQEGLPSNAANVKLFQILDDWGNQFKRSVTNLVMDLAKQKGRATRQRMASLVKRFNIPQDAAAAAMAEPESAPEPTPNSPPEELAPEDPENEEPPVDAVTGPSQGRNPTMNNDPGAQDKLNWQELSQEEKDAWDARGGGESPENINKKTNLYKLGVANLPYILRKGDPRIDVIRSIKRGSRFKSLIGAGRVEGWTLENGKPVRTSNISAAEFPQRLEAAKAAVEQKIQANSKPRKAGWVTRKSQNQEVEPTTQEPVVTQPNQTLEKEPPKPKKNPLGDKLKSLRSGGSEAPKSEVKPEAPKSKREELYAKIDKLEAEGADEETIDHLRGLIDNGDYEEVENFMNILDDQESGADEEEYNIDKIESRIYNRDVLSGLSPKDKTKVFKSLLEHGDVNMVSHQKLIKMPFSERVKYLKGLLNE